MMELNLNDFRLNKKTNIVLQVHRSHLERVVDFLADTFPRNNTATYIGIDGAVDVFESSSNGAREDSDVDATPADSKDNFYKCNESKHSSFVQIVATKKVTASKTCSLIFLHAIDEKAFLDSLLIKYKFILKGVNKMYVVTNNWKIMTTNHSNKSEIGDVCECISPMILDMMQQLKSEGDGSTPEVEPSADKSASALTNSSADSPRRKQRISVKVETFPSKLQRQIVSNLFSLLDTKSIPEEELDIGPTNQTHTISIIQIDQTTNGNKHKRGEHENIFLVGIASVEQTVPPIYPPSESNDVCRAFYKLAEAFERYHANNKASDWPFPFLKPGSKRKVCNSQIMLGVDCGAAPGGWTKYLIDKTPCNEIYSIDPGEMTDSIASLPNVHHMKMTAASAIPQLREMLARRNTAISIWVSDMCVHEMSKQVDVFLDAKKAGIFLPGAAFVLTIKCNVGHAKERFDEMTDREVDRLKEVGAHGLKILHLFTNRNGERTVMGYL